MHDEISRELIPVPSLYWHDSTAAFAAGGLEFSHGNPRKKVPKESKLNLCESVSNTSLGVYLL